MIAAITNLGPEIGIPERESGWGVGRLVRLWLAPRIAHERSAPRVDGWGGSPVASEKPAVISPADVQFDRRTASAALHQALAEWRAAERRLASSPAGRGDPERASLAVSALRVDYQQRFEALRTALLEG